ncbi:serine hydroxymethyltransferase [bacterium]|nr:serine hydroxymethyltransferase [bacterium]MBU1152878.1 serine hydroxymethyltransferase [bacterium]MBU1782036.1 serine hydroxymethyltransferase [bacterium]
MNKLWQVDPEVAKLIEKEKERQEERLEMIASENVVSEAVLLAQGSILTNKYAEGYPGRRYYGGCENVDTAEVLAQQRAKIIFGAKHVNVQPHSGSQANMAVYLSMLKPGDKILGLDLTHGGHLTHGSTVNFSGILYRAVTYRLRKEDQLIDYQDMEEIALQEKPKMIIAGASAYPRTIDFQRFQSIAQKVGAYLMADIAHIAGLVAAKLHPDPVPYCDFVTTTTHKTLRGPRGGIIMCREEYGKLIDKAIFPGIQGGPLMHIIAAKAVCLKEAMTEEFRDYQKQVIKNAKVLAKELNNYDFNLITGGTDNHLILIDLRNKNINGTQAEKMLGESNITVNKNTVPYDTEKAFVTSGIRLGTPILTSRGMKEEEIKEVAYLINKVISSIGKEDITLQIKKEVKDLCKRFPLYN